MRPDIHSRIDAAEREAVITTSFHEPPHVVWTLFSDPTRLARWWGPPGVPMTVDHHDLRVGGTVELTVSTSQGDMRGQWTIHEVTAPHTLTFTFSSDGLDPTEIEVRIEDTPHGSSDMTITARFSSDATMRHALDIGFVDGVVRSCIASHTVLSDP